MDNRRLYSLIWRWHFCAGLFVLPFILILSVTGSVYLFKPQIDRWEERSFHGLHVEKSVSPDEQLAAVMAANPGARFNHYRPPEHDNDAAMVQLGLADGSKREIYVSPEGEILGALTPDTRIADTASRIHGSLFLGKWGDWLVELAASWTIVMILTGLYLWWPRPFRLAGIVWPRLSLRGRPLLKDIHRVVGFWIAGLILVMLASGLPWTGVWGSSFQWVRSELGLVGGPPQDWQIGAAKPVAADIVSQPSIRSLPLSFFVAKARTEGIAPPVLIIPPHGPQQFGPPNGDYWTVQSDAQNRRVRNKISYDPTTGAETNRSGFSDQHVIDRVINTGISWHEGQLFGLANQLVGALTALGLIGVSILGTWMWLKRRPQGKLAAPQVEIGPRTRWTLAALIVFGVLLPLFGLSLIILLIFDRAFALTRQFSNRAMAEE